MQHNTEITIDIFDEKFTDEQITMQILKQNDKCNALLKINREIERFNFALNQNGYTPNDLKRMKLMRRIYNFIENL